MAEQKEKTILDKLGDLAERCFPEDEYRSVCVILLAIVLTIVLGVTVCNIVEDVMTNVKCIAQPEVCIQKVPKCPNK